MLRSVTAVFAGYVGIAVVTMLLWVLWPHAPRDLPTSGLLILSLLIGLVAAVAGGALAGAVARRAEAQHAALLALVFVALETAAAPFSAGGNPLWHDLAALLSGVAGVMLGGAVAHRRAVARRARRRAVYEGLFSASSANPQEAHGSMGDRSRSGHDGAPRVGGRDEHVRWQSE